MTEIQYYDILAIRPEYVSGTGDCTEIIYESGEVYIVNKNIKSVVNNMAHYYCTDLRANRHNYGKTLGIKNNVPIVFSDKYILVPYKARKPWNKRDGAYGYINLFNYVDLCKEQEDDYILMTAGIKLKLFQNLESFRKRVHLAKRLITERR